MKNPNAKYIFVQIFIAIFNNFNYILLNFKSKYTLKFINTINKLKINYNKLQNKIFIYSKIRLNLLNNINIKI